MTRMPHLSAMTWDEVDQLRSTKPNAGGTPQVTWYAYDGGGQRARKVTDQPGTTVPKAERIYLGAVEVYREYAADGTTITLSRETLHVNDGGQAAALVEDRTSGIDKGSASLVRYQHGNHLGSALLELDGAANIITYEEYFPYGSTSYQAVTSQTETPKRYRYTGKERDEESGLSYHSARYYATWLGRWASCDPIGPASSLNLYTYGADCPTRLADPSGKDPQQPQTSGAAGSEDEHKPQMAGPAAVNVKDAAERERYNAAKKAAARDAEDTIKTLSKEPGNEEAAAKAALDASKNRNVLRTETQGKLSPGGRAISEALEKERGLSYLWEEYGVASESYEAALAIAAASGRGRVWFTRVSRGLGVVSVVTLGLSIYWGVERIIHTPADNGRV